MIRPGVVHIARLDEKWEEKQKEGRTKRRKKEEEKKEEEKKEEEKRDKEKGNSSPAILAGRVEWSGTEIILFF